MFDLQIDRYRIRPDNGATFRLDRYADPDTCAEAIATPVGERAPQPSWSVYPGSFDRCLKRLHDDWRTQTDSPAIEVAGDLDDVLERINDVWQSWEKWWVGERARIARAMGKQADAAQAALDKARGYEDSDECAECGTTLFDDEPAVLYAGTLYCSHTCWTCAGTPTSEAHDDE